MEEVLWKAREFRTKGIFDREMGDVVLRVCCNILQIPILVITSNHTVPYLSFKCDQSVTNEPIFLAFHYYGAGHYDATESITSGKEFFRIDFSLSNNALFDDVYKVTLVTVVTGVQSHLKFSSKFGVTGLVF